MILYILGIALQVACAVHAFRTGRAYWWIFIILLAPMVGCLIYFFVEIVPGLRGSRAASKLGKIIDPERDLKRRADDLAIADTVQNKMELAQECLRTGRAEKALELYESSLSGIYKNDPKILLGVAQARFELGQFAAVKDALDKLIEANPDFKSSEGHFLYARALEELKDDEAALEEYAALVKYHSSVEVKCRYALLLRRHGDNDLARGMFDDIVLNARRYRQFHKGEGKRWVEIAKENLAQMKE